MARYTNNSNEVSSKTKEESMSAAKATLRPGQTKEQTKLITQGIQKGIEHYKKQQKSKARELDKQLKKAKHLPVETEVETEVVVRYKLPWLPWSLLGISWVIFIAYVLSAS